jgi:TATA-box binding protein (TBP) (component of TFIID and TFIIIB)
MIKPKVVLLIFVSGKIVLTGAKVTIRFLSFLFHMTCIVVVITCGSRDCAM